VRSMAGTVPPAIVSDRALIWTNRYTAKMGTDARCNQYSGVERAIRAGPKTGIICFRVWQSINIHTIGSGDLRFGAAANKKWLTADQNPDFTADRNLRNVYI